MKTLPLKRLVNPRRPITYGIVQAGPDTPGGVPYIRPTDMTNTSGLADASTLLRTTPDIAATYKRSEIAPGDLVVSIGPSFGKIMIVPAWLAGANLTQGTARVDIRQETTVDFAYWALQSKIARDYWNMAAAGATFRALNLEPLSLTPIPVIEVDEQVRVARFLKAEIARLDGLISRDQSAAKGGGALARLSELIVERREALITAAVTGQIDVTTARSMA